MARSGYDFYLDKCLLPVTPSKLQIKINNANKTLTLIDEGQINILKTLNLRILNLNVIFHRFNIRMLFINQGSKVLHIFLITLKI